MQARIRAASIAALLLYVFGGPALGADEGDYLRLEQVDPALVTYEVSETTAAGRWSNSQQDVQLTINGSKPNEQPIRQTLQGPFYPAHAARIFPLAEGRNIGFACSIELDTDGPDGWLPAAIDVAYLIQGREFGRTKFSNGGKNLPWIDSEGCGGAWQQQGAVNLALSGTATQSSILQNNPVAHASKAIDGTNNGAWSARSMSHTNVEDNPWWQVELKQRSTINQIVLWNRTDCCADRLTNAEVMIWDKNPADPNAPTVWWRQTGFFNTNADGSIDTTKMVLLPPDGIKGQMVSVQVTGKTWLQLAEVEVWGLPNPTGPAACQRTTRYFPDVVPPACHINRNISQQQTQPSVAVQDLRVLENDHAQLLTVNVNGFAQNAAGQSGEVTLQFAIVVNGDPVWLEVDTSMSQGGVRAEVSKPVALRGNPAPVQERMTIPYRAFRALSPRNDPYEVWVFARLATGSAEAFSDQNGVGVRIWIQP